MRAELELDMNNFDDAISILLGIPEHFDEDNQGFEWLDGFAMAALLKSLALTNNSTDGYEDLIQLVPTFLENNRHPSQRIAYWATRWLSQTIELNSEIIRRCLSHLVNLTEEPAFQHDVLGVILACELCSLQKEGLIEFESEQFLDLVLKNSQLTTVAWVKEHYSPDDPLGPLNFNYC